MKLRNKHTGRIGNSMGSMQSKFISICVDYCDGSPREYIYDSIAELNEEWEDYEPVEPLIKDEKIRKTVRAWAEAVGRTKTFVVSYNVEYHDCCIYTSGLSDTAMIDLGTDLNVREGCYSITELCGEEEE